MLWSSSTRIELAGHERREVDDASVLDARPLAVRARQHREHAALVGADARRAICVSSPRMTSGMPAASRVATPGTIVSASCGACTTRSASAGRATRGSRRTAPRPSPGGCRSCRTRCAAPGRRASRRAASPAPARTRAVTHVLDRRAARCAGPARDRSASRRYARAADRSPIDRDERRGGHEARLAYQRAAASSSLARASTQRSPSGIRSFFQNGARVFR